METLVATTPLTSAAPLSTLTDYVQESVQEASQIIAAYWPISTFIANNALSGLEKRPFSEAMQYAEQVRGGLGYLPLTHYRQLYDQGRINDSDLETAASQWLERQKLPAATTINRQMIALPNLYRRWLLQTVARPEDNQALALREALAARLRSLELDLEDETRPLQTRGDQTTLRDGRSATEVVNQRMIKWCAAFLDEGQAAWAMPGREQGFYKAWQPLAGYDKALQKYTRRPLHKELKQLPGNPAQALAQSLNRLGIDRSAWPTYLTRHLAQLPGWASLIRWRQEHEEAEAQQRYPINLTEYLAVRVFYEAALVETAPAERQSQPAKISSDLGQRLAGLVTALDLDAAAIAKLAEPDFIALADLARRSTSLQQRHIWQTAYEIHYRRELLANLAGASRPATPATPTTPAAQALFCIDVRSEGLRRNLESQGAYQTFGFAGFFGLPMLYQALGAACPVVIGPALIKPNQPVKEVPVEADATAVERYLSNHQRRSSWGNLIHKLRENLLTPFAFVEMTGWTSLVALVGKTVAPQKWQQAKNRLATNYNPPLAVRPSIIENDAEMPLADQASAVAGMLKSISLTTNFARFVLICGHGSATENNPYASALDCGACGGNHGGESAIVAAGVLNSPSVRRLLAEQHGITIPQETFFLAGEHNTTTDRVEILNQTDLPATHRAALAEFERALAEAGKGAATERWAKLPAVPGNQFDPSHLEQRASDWAQVRPEWGLVRNAAFICGRRELTSGLSLENRVFLHSYDPTQDPEGAVLEGIMTAPVVVAEWINMQYYLSTVDNAHFGSSTKLLHTVVGQVGVMQGQQSDLLIGLPQQSVMLGQQLFHEPLRLSVIIEAPTERLSRIVAKHELLQQLTGNEWITLLAYNAASNQFHQYQPDGSWVEAK